MRCPKCISTKLRDITDQDDKIRIYFCCECTFQANALAFEFFDEPIEEETPSLFARIVAKFRALFKRHNPRS